MRYLNLVILILSVSASHCWFEGIIQKGIGAIQTGLGAVENKFNEVTGHDAIRSVYKRVFGMHVLPNADAEYPLSIPTRLTLLPLSDIEHFVHFAAAAYCASDVLSRFTCNECLLTGPNVELIQVLSDSTLETTGFISVDKDRQEIVVTFRGASNPTNWITDFTIDFTNSPLGDGALIHEGYYQATMSLQHQVSYIVQSQLRRNPNYGVVFTGHSNGGAIAVLSYYLLSAELPDLKYTLVTFGEPRVGNKAFADIINARSIPSARVVNEGDLVPHSKAWSLGFVHHQTEYWTVNGTTRICSNAVYEDLTCSSSLPLTKLVIADHLTYLGINIGILNCIDENAVSGIRGIFGGG